LTTIWSVRKKTGSDKTIFASAADILAYQYQPAEIHPSADGEKERLTA
jgi:hypothetical protein